MRLISIIAYIKTVSALNQIVAKLSTSCLSDSNKVCLMTYEGRTRCSKDIVTQRSLYSRYCPDTVATDFALNNCMSRFPCSSCLPLISCSVDVCSLGWESLLKPATVQESDTACTALSSEKRCCFAEALKESQFACHVCNEFELPATLRFGGRWVCEDHCINPSSDIVMNSLLFAMGSWLVVSFCSITLAFIFRGRPSLNESRLPRRVIDSYKFIRKSPLSTFLLAFGGFLQFCFYIDRSYYKQVQSGTVQIELFFTSFMLLELLVSLIACSLLGLRESIGLVFTSFVDLFCITSSFSIIMFSEEGLKSWFSFAFVGSIKALLGCSRVSYTSRYRGYIEYILSISFLILNCACLLQLAHLNDSSSIVSSDSFVWDLGDAFYFLLMSAASIGEASLYPKTWFGKVVTVIWVIGNVFTFGQLIYMTLSNSAGDVFKRLSIQRVSLKRFYSSFLIGEINDFVLITGNPSCDTLIDAISELLHPDHNSSATLKIVCLLPNPPKSLMVWLELESNERIRNRILVVEGDARFPEDLQKVQLVNSKAVIVLPVRDVIDEDIMNAERVRSIRRMSWSVPIVLALNNDDLKSLVGNSERITIIPLDKIKMQLLARSCSVPGFLPLVINLVRSFDFPEESPTAWVEGKSQWLSEYQQGLGMEIYVLAISDCYAGMTFGEVAEDVYILSDPASVLLIGLVEYENNHKYMKKVRIYPGQDYVLQKHKVNLGIFIASDADKIIQSRPEEGHRRQMWQQHRPGSKESSNPTTGRDTVSEKIYVKSKSARRSQNRDPYLPGQAYQDHLLSTEPKPNVSLTQNLKVARMRGELHVFVNFIRAGLIKTERVAEILMLEPEMVTDAMAKDPAYYLEMDDASDAVIETPVRKESLAGNKSLHDSGTVSIDDRPVQCVDHIVLLIPDLPPRAIVGLRHFKLASMDSESSRTFIVVANHRPSDWNDVSSNWIFIEGSPNEHNVLLKARIIEAQSVVVFASRGEHSEADRSTSILAARIDLLVPKHTNVIVEFLEENTLQFLPLLKDAASLKEQELRSDDHASYGKFNPRYCPQYLGGRVGFSSFLNAVCASVVYNESLSDILQSLITSSSLICKVPAEYTGKPYRQFHLKLTRNGDLLPIAIQRKFDPIGNRKKRRGGEFDFRSGLSRIVGDFFNLQKNVYFKVLLDATKVALGNSTGMKDSEKHYDLPPVYFVTAPSQDLLLRPDDTVICLNKINNM